MSERNPIEIIQARDKVVHRICEEKGWDMASLALEQILDIRKDPEWIDPLKDYLKEV